jgi:hypothetical protein
MNLYRVHTEHGHVDLHAEGIAAARDAVQAGPGRPIAIGVAFWADTLNKWIQVSGRTRFDRVPVKLPRPTPEALRALAARMFTKMTGRQPKAVGESEPTKE